MAPSRPLKKFTSSSPEFSSAIFGPLSLPSRKAHNSMACVTWVRITGTTNAPFRSMSLPVIFHPLIRLQGKISSSPFFSPQYNGGPDTRRDRKRNGRLSKRFYHKTFGPSLYDAISLRFDTNHPAEI